MPAATGHGWHTAYHKDPNGVEEVANAEHLPRLGGVLADRPDAVAAAYQIATARQLTMVQR